MVSEDTRSGVLIAGVAGSVFMGVVCWPIGLLLGAATAIFAHAADVDRYADSSSGTELVERESFVESVPRVYEDLARGVQSGVHDIAVAEAYEIARQRAVEHEGASFRVGDLGDEVTWSVYSKNGRLLEHGEIEIPLQY